MVERWHFCILCWWQKASQLTGERHLEVRREEMHVRCVLKKLWCLSWSALLLKLRKYIELPKLYCQLLFFYNAALSHNLLWEHIFSSCLSCDCWGCVFSRLSVNLTVGCSSSDRRSNFVSQFSIAKLNFSRPWHLPFILPEEDRSTFEPVPVHLQVISFFLMCDNFFRIF